LLGPFSSRIAPALPLLIRRDRVTRFRHITIGILQILPADARLGSRRALSVTSAATLWARHILAIDHGRATRSTGHRPGSYPLPEPQITEDGEHHHHDADHVENVHALPPLLLPLTLVVMDLPAHWT